MKYSLFRFIDVFEATTIYSVCFISNLLLLFVDTSNLEVSFILNYFLKNIAEYKIAISILLTSIIIVFHYQFLQRRKKEVFCRILIGDTIVKIRILYFKNILTILVFSFSLSLPLNFYLGLNITSNLYLVFIFILYIIFSTGRVKKE